MFALCRRGVCNGTLPLKGHIPCQFGPNLSFGCQIAHPARLTPSKMAVCGASLRKVLQYFLDAFNPPVVSSLTLSKFLKIIATREKDKGEKMYEMLVLHRISIDKTSIYITINKILEAL
jgi:hypothetical protein